MQIGIVSIFSHLCPLIFFSSSTILTKSILKRSEKRWQLFLYPGLNRIASSFYCLFRIILAVRLLFKILIMLILISSSPILYRTFIMKTCLICQIFCIYRDNSITLILSQLIVFIDSNMLKHPCISSIKVTSLWWIICFIYFYIQPSYILLKICVSLFTKDIGFQIYICCAITGFVLE